jgi:pimeloyl-ACP methyl ester carboxylesterase
MKIAGFAETTVSANGIDLLVRTAGEGPPVLLWHGFLETGLCWREVADDLARDHRVIVPDMRGYGGSSKPADGYDAATLRDDFRALVAQLDLGPVHLVAHDMGAPPALLWAGTHPEEVASLTYIEEPHLSREALAPLFAFERETYAIGGLWWWGLGLAPDAAERILPGRERASLTWFYDHYTAHRAAIPDGLVDAYLESFTGPAGIAGAFGVYRAVFGSMEQLEAVRQVNCPVLAIGGEGSLGAKVGEMLVPLCPDLRTEVVAEAGHFVPDEQLEALAALLHPFFAAAQQE